MMNLLVIVSVLVIVTKVSFAGAAVSDDYVNPHNAARKAVTGANIGNLTWNTDLAIYATNWANKQATSDNCNLKHSRGPYRENIYWSSWQSVPGDAVKAWVSEKPYYNYSTNSCQKNQVCGHYTQVIF
jgi:pathogenesis-related protein 1